MSKSGGGVGVACWGGGGFQVQEPDRLPNAGAKADTLFSLLFLGVVLRLSFFISIRSTIGIMSGNNGSILFSSL